MQRSLILPFQGQKSLRNLRCMFDGKKRAGDVRASAASCTGIYYPLSVSLNGARIWVERRGNR